ncbi:citrate synthase [Devosia sp. A369]
MDWLTATEALALLGTQPQTLYANVSRGRIKARSDPADSRRSLYRGDDVRRLAQRGAGRRQQSAVAVATMHWGEPVLQSAISTVVEGRLLYRGRDAVELAATATLEEIAALLWDAAPLGQLPAAAAGDASIGAAFAALAGRAAIDPPSLGRSPAVLQQEAAAILSIVGAALTASPSGADPLHTRLAASWGCPAAADTLRRTLVLLADHELNASTFAARVTASTGASLAAATLSGLAALTGPLHGSAATAVLALADDAARDGAEAAVMARLGQGMPVPAFGHPLYPDGDTRAQHLLAQMPVPPLFAALAEAGERITGDRPNIDFALAALTVTHGLPRQAPLLIFALSRCAGWLAHAQEQAASGELIRPRARFVGGRT